MIFTSLGSNFGAINDRNKSVAKLVTLKETILTHGECERLSVFLSDEVDDVDSQVSSSTCVLDYPVIRLIKSKIF